MVASSYSVLIVGAGPTGMALALELERYGIHFLIIDKRPSSVTTSNAAAIHARTLECWHKASWLNDFLIEGLKIRAAAIHAKEKLLAYFDFHQLKNTLYPLILSIPQNQTEKILDEHLQNAVKRNTTLTHLTINQNNVLAKLSTPEGDKEITADWVVGCDGFHSTVRDFANIEFKGEDIEERFLLVDADLEVNYDQDSFHIYLSSQGILAFFKMKNSTRIIAGIGHDPQFQNVKEPTLEVMSEIIKQRTSLQFKINSIFWQSHFWIHERVATQFKKGRVFIAGDAAHVHSPAGGQGMNTGIQDAQNLAWKLAYVIQKKAPVSLLESYEFERRPIAKSVVEMASTMTRMANVKNPFLVTLRNFILPWITQRSLFQKIMCGRMSELSLRYASSDIIQGKKLNQLSPGERAANFLISENPKKYLLDALDNKKHTLFVFYKNDSERNQALRLQLEYKEIFDVVFLTAKKFSLSLIRPDGYVGFSDNNINRFENYLKHNYL